MSKRIEKVTFTLEEENLNKEIIDVPLTHLASEQALAKDWSKPEEDLVWKDL